MNLNPYSGKVLYAEGSGSGSAGTRLKAINRAIHAQDSDPERAGRIGQTKIAAKGTVNSFWLNDGEFFINDERQPEAVHQRFKNMFIKEPGYEIYLGNAPKNGKGIFLSRDSL